MAKKTVMKISPEGMKKIADHLGFKGDMANLKEFLASDPAKQHLVNRYYDKAKKLYKAAKGGMLYAQAGGATTNDQRPPPFKPGEQGVPGIDNLPPSGGGSNNSQRDQYGMPIVDTPGFPDKGLPNPEGPAPTQYYMRKGPDGTSKPVKVDGMGRTQFDTEITEDEYNKFIERGSPTDDQRMRDDRARPLPIDDNSRPRPRPDPTPTPEPLPELPEDSLYSSQQIADMTPKEAYDAFTEMNIGANYNVKWDGTNHGDYSNLDSFKSYSGWDNVPGGFEMFKQLATKAGLGQENILSSQMNVKSGAHKYGEAYRYDPFAQADPPEQKPDQPDGGGDGGSTEPEVSPIEQEMQDMARDPKLKGDQRVDAEKIDYDKASQDIRQGTGQLKGSDPQARVKTAGQAGDVSAPRRKAGATYDATLTKGAVDAELARTKAAQLDKKSIDTIDAAQEDESSVADLEAEQGEGIKMDDLKTSGRERKLSEEEKVEAVADAREAAEFTEDIKAAQGEPSEKATMRGQMAEYMKDFEDGNVPKWAAGAMRAVVNQMAAQGISGSNATQAAMQAMLEKSIDLASVDAATFSKFESQNLSNRQQRAMLAAEQRAKFMGQEFDQKFQSRVINASKVSDVANMNFTAEQQIALENSRIANTMNLQNLSNKQALIMAEASAVSNLDMANLNNRQQANVQNAQNFLAVDMANLNNRQQTSMFKAQAAINSIMSDAAAQNAAKQFNAQSENQMNQFYDNLGTQVQQFNASQSNAMSQFNAGQENAMSQFNTSIQNQRDQFNAQNQMVIAQSNTQWRRQIATADTAAQNRANELNAQALIGMSTMAYQQIWQQYGDAMERAWRSSEGKLDRLTSLAQTKMEIEGKANLASAQRRSNNIGLIGGFLMDFLGF